MISKKTAFQRAKTFLGAEVKDTITGVTGKCTGIAIYDKRFDIIEVRVEHLDKNDFLQTDWFGHTRIEIVKAADEE